MRLTNLGRAEQGADNMPTPPEQLAGDGPEDIGFEEDASRIELEPPPLRTNMSQHPPRATNIPDPTTLDVHATSQHSLSTFGTMLATWVSRWGISRKAFQQL